MELKNNPNKYKTWQQSPLRLLTQQEFYVSYAGRQAASFLCLPTTAPSLSQFISCCATPDYRLYWRF